MSLLDRGNADILLYPEEVVISRDGNKQTRASKTPVKMRVWLAPIGQSGTCLLYTSPSPRDRQKSRMPSSA